MTTATQDTEPPKNFYLEVEQLESTLEGDILNLETDKKKVSVQPLDFSREFNPVTSTQTDDFKANVSSTVEEKPVNSPASSEHDGEPPLMHRSEHIQDVKDHCSAPSLKVKSDCEYKNYKLLSQPASSVYVPRGYPQDLVDSNGYWLSHQDVKNTNSISALLGRDWNMGVPLSGTAETTHRNHFKYPPINTFSASLSQSGIISSATEVCQQKSCLQVPDSLLSYHLKSHLKEDVPSCTPTSNGSKLFPNILPRSIAPVDSPERTEGTCVCMLTKGLIVLEIY